MIENLYLDAGAPLFPGYAPVTTFQHAARVLVCEFKPQAPHAYGAKMYEERMPAAFYSATLENEEGPVCMFSTGSGHEAGQVLAQLLDALSQAKACFDYGYDSTDRVVHFAAEDDGRNVTLSRTNIGFFEVHAHETQDFTGRVLPDYWLYFECEILARQVAKQLVQGMLEIKPPLRTANS